jgi:hypothetical protein
MIVFNSSNSEFPWNLVKSHRNLCFFPRHFHPSTFIIGFIHIIIIPLFRIIIFPFFFFSCSFFCYLLILCIKLSQCIATKSHPNYSLPALTMQANSLDAYSFYHTPPDVNNFDNCDQLNQFSGGHIQQQSGNFRCCRKAVCKYLKALTVSLSSKNLSYF